MVSKRVELLDVINRSSALALDGEAQKNAKGWVGCFRLVADARAARANEYYRPGADSGEVESGRLALDMRGRRSVEPFGFPLDEISRPYLHSLSRDARRRRASW